MFCSAREGQIINHARPLCGVIGRYVLPPGDDGHITQMAAERTAALSGVGLTARVRAESRSESELESRFESELSHGPCRTGVAVRVEMELQSESKPLE